MKNLMIYISPTGSFNNPRVDFLNDAAQLIKIQYENSLSLGWKKKDIMLITNFKYQYGDLKAKVLKDVDFFDIKPQASKVNAIVKLFEMGTIKRGELYWFHDLDAFQLESFKPNEIVLRPNQIALTDYGGWSRVNTGTIFFKDGSQDIFSKVKETMYQKNVNEEKAIGILSRDDKRLKKRIIKLNKSYNFTPFNFRQNYKKAIKPIRVVHFHPLVEIKPLGLKRSLDFFMGENELKIPLLTEQLIKIFKYHRIR